MMFKVEKKKENYWMRMEAVNGQNATAKTALQNFALALFFYVLEGQ